jgi:hypothetical protein
MHFSTVHLVEGTTLKHKKKDSCINILNIFLTEGRTRREPKNLPDTPDYVALQQGNENNNITNENETALLFLGGTPRPFQYWKITG